MFSPVSASASSTAASVATPASTRSSASDAVAQLTHVSNVPRNAAQVAAHAITGTEAKTRMSKAEVNDAFAEWDRLVSNDLERPADFGTYLAEVRHWLPKSITRYTDPLGNPSRPVESGFIRDIGAWPAYILHCERHPADPASEFCRELKLHPGTFLLHVSPAGDPTEDGLQKWRTFVSDRWGDREGTGDFAQFCTDQFLKTVDWSMKSVGRAMTDDIKARALTCSAKLNAAMGLPANRQEAPAHPPSPPAPSGLEPHDAPEQWDMDVGAHVDAPLADPLDSIDYSPYDEIFHDAGPNAPRPPSPAWMREFAPD